MLLAFFSSLVIAATLIFLTKKTLLGRVFQDPPSARGLHNIPVPRIGGVALLSAVVLTVAPWMQRDSVAFIACLSLMLLFVSLIDDLRALPALLRLLVHTATAILVVLLWLKLFSPPATLTNVSSRWQLHPLSAIALVFAIVWMTNLYNFMDGADGLAGGMTVIGFGTYSLALVVQANVDGNLALLVAAISGAAAGFLIFNFSPAKVFMGDAGSIPLGFLAATLGVHGCLQQMWPWWFPLLVFSPFIVDASATLVRRTAQGNKPWIAHRDHYYQRLVLGGWSHRKTALVYYCLMLASAGSALVAIRHLNARVMLITWVITYGLLLLLTEWHLHQKKNNKIKNNDCEKT